MNVIMMYLTTIPIDLIMTVMDEITAATIPPTPPGCEHEYETEAGTQRKSKSGFSREDDPCPSWNLPGTSPIQNGSKRVEVDQKLHL